MMDCSEVQRLIPAYCRGELGDDMRCQVEEHLAGCPTCHDEVDREECLRQTLSGQAADDPPRDYWDGFNTRLRSRTRGTVGVLWGLGCLPGALIGLVGGVIISTLLFSSAFARVLDRIGFIGLLIVALCIGLALRFIYKRADRRVSASLGEDESTLKRLIRANPICRAIFPVASTIFWLGMAAYISVIAASHAEHVPIMTRIVLAILVFLGFAVSCSISTVRYIRSDGGRPRNTPISRAFILLAFAALMSLNLWQMSIDDAMDAPSKVRHRAESVYKAGNTRSAIAMLRSSIKKQPDSPRVLECYELLGKIYKDKGQPVQARAAYGEGIQAYERLLKHPHYNYTTFDRGSMAFHASELYDGLGNERKADELRRLNDRLWAEPDF